MELQAPDILVEICRYARSHNLPLGAVRAQKLCYLLECEYYAWERTRLTNLDWQFYHYGPWSATLDQVVREEFQMEPELLADGRVFHRITYQENEYFKRPSALSADMRGMFLRIMDAWSPAPMEELLDHVYFHTAPMRDVQRGQALDFSTVPSARDTRFPLNPYSLLKANQKEELKRMLAEWASRAKSRRRPPAQPVDELVAEVIHQLDAQERFQTFEGDVLIPDEPASIIKEQTVE